MINKIFDAFKRCFSILKSCKCKSSEQMSLLVPWCSFWIRFMVKHHHRRNVTSHHFFYYYVHHLVNLHTSVFSSYLHSPLVTSVKSVLRVTHVPHIRCLRWQSVRSFRKRFVYVPHCPAGPSLDCPLVIDPTGVLSFMLWLSWSSHFMLHLLDLSTPMIFQTNPLLSLIKKIIVSRWWKGFPLVSKRNLWRCISEERGWEAIIFAGSRLQKNRLIMGDDYDNPYHHQDQHCHHHNFHNCHQSPSRIIAL